MFGLDKYFPEKRDHRKEINAILKGSSMKNPKTASLVVQYRNKILNINTEEN